MVDCYHVPEQAWEVAKDLRRDLGRGSRSELEEGHSDAWLATAQPRSDDRKTAAECMAYKETNRERMRDANYRAEGLQIDCESVGALYETVGGASLTLAGMHWTDGAGGILALRACIPTGRCENLWAWCSELQTAAAT